MHKKKIEEVQLANGIKAIGEATFQGFKALRSMILGRDVEQFENLIFEGCDNLLDIIPTKDNKNYKNYEHSLYSKDLRVLVKYPTGNTNKTFTVPQTVTHIGDRAFAFNEHIEEIIIQHRIDYVGFEAFADCFKLESITYNNEQEPICDEDVFGDSFNGTITVHASYPKNETFCEEEVIHMEAGEEEAKELARGWKILIGFAAVVGFILVAMTISTTCVLIVMKCKNEGFVQFEDESDDYDGEYSE